MGKKQNKKSFSNFINNPLDFTLVIDIFLLLGIGLVMVLSASSPSALAKYSNSYYYFIRQLIFAVLGIFAMFAISRVDYRKYQKFYKQAYWLSIILLIAVLVVGKEINGAKRWIFITNKFSFQPSELVKILIIIFYAEFLSRDRKELPYFWKGMIKHFLCVAPIAVLLLLQPHLSATMVIVSIVVIMMIVAGCKLKDFIIACLIVGVPGLAGLIAFEPYRLQRFATFLNPFKDKTGSGWQVVQSLYAIGSGGIFGVGLGESKQKYLYIPEPQNDFIFSIIAEELGFVGCTIILILFAILIWRGVLIAMKAPDMFGSLVAIGITSMIAVQVILNVAVVTSSIPATGIPLPFFSYGGTALFVLLCEMGILLNISRAGTK